MSKTFLRTVLAAFAAAGVAGAQTPTPPPSLTPTSTPPMPAAAAPVRQVAFKVMPQPVPPAAPRFFTKVFDVTDLVCPPKDSPLAAPSDDVAMQAAVTAYAKVRVEQLKKILRNTVSVDSWEENGGPGRMDYYPVGQALVVHASADVVVRVGECLESLRKLQPPQVFVQMLVIEVASDHPAVAKLFAKKRESALTAEELKKLMTEMKADGALEVLSRPQLMLTDKQTGFFQTGQQFPRLTGTTLDGGGVKQGVEYISTGLVVRLTPDCAGDGKAMRMRTEVSLTEPSRTPIDLGNGIKATPIDTQAIEAVLELADGGTMAVNIGTKKVERRIETKVPVLGDIPYLDRIFKTVGISHERRDTVVVFTATRVNTEQQLRTLIASEVAKLSWSFADTPAVMPMAVPPPMAKPVSVGDNPFLSRNTAPVPVGPTFKFNTCEAPGGERAAPPVPMPAAPPVAVVPQAMWRSTAVTPIPMPIHNPFALVPPVAPPMVVREVAVVGLERIDLGVDSHLIPASGSVPVTGRIAGAGHGGIPAGDETTTLLKAYRAACAAGKKDEASRLALQLLAKDPTCFGRDR